MGPLAAILLALAAAHVQVAAGSLQQCYVCEPRGGDTVGSLSALFHDQQPVLKCEDFKKDDARFVKNCPEEYKGCLTQSVVIGHHVTRTCGDLKVNDCQVANGVQYCYCSGALCNGQTQDPPPDDEPEDSVEGSASGEDAAAKHRHKQQQTLGTPPTTPTSVVLPTTHASSHVKGATAAAATRTNHKLSLVLTLVPCLAVAVGARRRY